MTHALKSVTSRNTRLTISAGLARGLIGLACQRGADHGELLRTAGVTAALLDDPDARLDRDSYFALMHAARAATGDPALALRFGEEVDASEFSVVGLLVRASATIGDALHQLNRFVSLIIEVEGVGPEGRFQLVRDEGSLWLIDTRQNPNDFPELTESSFTRIVTGARRVGVEDFVSAVHVTHAAPAWHAEYARVFRAPVTFGANRNAMCLNERRLAHPIAASPRYAFGIFSQHAQALLAKLEQSRTMRCNVERVLMPRLHTGEAGMETIARELCMSRQTLFRKLRDEGVTFEQVLDSLRHRLALHYLDGNKVSVSEAAYLVGFSDPAAFSRAFKRWTGRSPSQGRGM